MTIITCPSGQTPIIKWTYPNEARREIAANEHSCIGAYESTQWQFTFTREGWTNSYPYYTESPGLYDFTGDAIMWQQLPSSWYLIAKCKNRI
jgi:hypothetical protein